MILPHQTFKITLQQNSCAMLHCCLLGVRQQIFYFLCPHPDFKYIPKTVYLDHLYCDVSYMISRKVKIYMDWRADIQ